MNNINIKNNNDIYLQNRELIVTVQEDERQRIARDLHDASLQTLTHMVHQLELCELYIDKDISKAKLELISTRQNLKTVIEEIRHIIFDLHPMSFDDLGLKQTFENFFDTLKKYSSFEFDILIDDIKGVNEYFLLSIYRIGRECVMNSIRHSKGSKLTFHCLKFDKYISLFIQDNGVGFTKESVLEKQNHFGLKVIYERVKILNGSIDIQNVDGTKIEIKLPFIFE